MAFYNWINENLFLPADEVFNNRPVSSYFKLLQNSQWWSVGEIEAYQNEKLKLLVAHAFNEVPYYNELFKQYKLTPGDIKSKEDLAKLPILTKEIIRKNFPGKLVAHNLPQKKLLMAGSSGSTGQPLQYFRTTDSLCFSRACNLRGWYWMGFRLGDSYMKISTMPRNTLYKKIQDRINNSYHVHSKSMTEADIQHIISTIRKNKIKFLRGYPASLFIIAKYLEANHIDDLQLKAINTTSEPLYPNMRHLIEQQFHCHIFDSYGAEGSPVISQCENHDLYHIASENAIVEFLSNSDLIAEGRAKMVFTDLTNYATPFLRYDVKDFVQLTERKCICGRNLPTIEKIEGRDTDILVTPSGRYITFYFFAGYFEHQDYIDMFQVVQKKSNEFSLKIVTNKNFTSKHIDKIHDDIINVLGNDVALNIEIVDDIPLTASGKRRFFIRNNDVPFDL